MTDASGLLGELDERDADEPAQRAMSTSKTNADGGGTQQVPPAASTPISKPIAADSSSVPSPAAGTVPVSYAELAAGLLALVLWFLLFGGGILIGTEPYRNQIAGAAVAANDQAPSAAVGPSLRLLMGIAAQPAPPTKPSSLLASVVMVLAFWTITNVGFLCCLAAFIGALGRRTRFAVLAHDPADYFDAVPERVRLHYASAVIRGFSIYCLMMAGLLVLATEQFKAPDPGTYLRLAATVTVVSFYAGYDPSVLASLLSRVKRLIDSSDSAVEEAELRKRGHAGADAQSN